MKQHLLQILVGVASSKMGTFDTACEKGSKWTAIRCGSMLRGRVRSTERRHKQQLEPSLVLDAECARACVCLQLIDGIYRGKMVSDEARAKMAPPQEPIPLADYVFQHLAGTV